MSFLSRGERRRGKVAAAATTVVALAAFQALAILGAGVASAVTGCTYNPGTQAIQITIDPAQTAGVAVEGDLAAPGLDTESPNGAILFNNNGAGYENGVLATQCGSASVTNTTSITVLGSPSTAETFTIEEALGDRFPTSIAWAVDLGSGTPDTFQVNLSEDVDNEVVLTDSTFGLNGATGPLLGAEVDNVVGNVMDDTIDGSALTANVRLFAAGGAGDDWIAPGFAAVLPLLGDVLDGGAGGEVNGDTLSYGTRTTTVYINGTTGLSGHDANADGDVVDVGDESDVSVAGSFENLESGSANDTLIGNGVGGVWFIPGDGDDKITGLAGDVIDWSSSSAAMNIDPKNGTATGQGTDTWTGVDGFYGSTFDDVLIWDAATTAYFAGSDGVDTVDASAKTSAQTINLCTLEGGTWAPPSCTVNDDTIENVIGGSGSDTLIGNEARNVLTGGDGNDNLRGAGGNDLFFGGLGNDTFSGDFGADTVDFGASANGIVADMSLGFASGEGDDAIGGIEIVKGSPQNDFITGGKFGTGSGINFWITGRAGNDKLTGSDSNDYLKGGAGNDKIRGGVGDDSLFGGKGKDKGWGGKGTDFCKGFEWTRGCE